MKAAYFWILLILSLIACKPSHKLVTNSKGEPVPQITWDQATIDLGKVYIGEQRTLEFPFTNSGSADLEIELVTACNCLSLDWPRQKVPPGERGVIKIVFDSSNQKLGKLKKTIDVIANTDPIVVEAFVNVEVLYKNNY